MKLIFNFVKNEKKKDKIKKKIEKNHPYIKLKIYEIKKSDIDSEDAISGLYSQEIIKNNIISHKLVNSVFTIVCIFNYIEKYTIYGEINLDSSNEYCSMCLSKNLLYSEVEDYLYFLDVNLYIDITIFGEYDKLRVVLDDYSAGYL